MPSKRVARKASDNGWAFGRLDTPSLVSCFACQEFSLDDRLTNIMVYWMTVAIISSLGYYKEKLDQGLMTRTLMKPELRAQGIYKFVLLVERP
ncbi:Epoxide hydrolase 1 [Fukomys damarensis]|uniref:Epoxide hydrolase 1 n=1 Tax=Fukomys damarensis TaxID=885580 RepID=A0A091D1S5_FUKDA|nr:Epoxide hydrolase 1 [Fukomys damarensis]